MPDDVNLLCAYYPKEWGVSRFQLGQIVRYKNDLAFVSGLNYVCEQSYFCQQEDFSPGFYCEITFITGEWAAFYETIGHHEDCIEQATEEDLDRLQVFFNELKADGDRSTLPGFVQNQLKLQAVAHV